MSSREEGTLYEDAGVKLTQIDQDWRHLQTVDPARRREILSVFRGAMNTNYLTTSATMRKLVTLNGEAGEAAKTAASDERASAMRVTQILRALSALMALAAMGHTILGIIRPLGAMTAAMRRVADGDAKTEIPSVGRRDEIGAMADTLDTFRANLMRSRTLEEETRFACAGAEAQRKAAMRKMASGVEGAVGGILGRVTAAAAQLRATAQGRAGTASETAQQSSTAAAAADQAASTVGMVTASAEELGASVQEIGRQVDGSTALAQCAVDEAARTAMQVRELSAAASKVTSRSWPPRSRNSPTRPPGPPRRSATWRPRSRRRWRSRAPPRRRSSRNVNEAATGTGNVTANIAGVAGAAEETGAAASQVLASASELSRESDHLNEEVGRFLATMRAA